MQKSYTTPDMESCFHSWVYDHCAGEDVFIRCPYCGMVRIAMPGETSHLVNRELNIRHDDRDGDV